MLARAFVEVENEVFVVGLKGFAVADDKDAKGFDFLGSSEVVAPNKDEVVVVWAKGFGFGGSVWAAAGAPKLNGVEGACDPNKLPNEGLGTGVLAVVVDWKRPDDATDGLAGVAPVLERGFKILSLC